MAGNPKATVKAGTRHEQEGNGLPEPVQRLPPVKDQESTDLVIDPDSRP